MICRLRWMESVAQVPSVQVPYVARTIVNKWLYNSNLLLHTGECVHHLLLIEGSISFGRRETWPVNICFLWTLHVNFSFWTCFFLHKIPVKSADLWTQLHWQRCPNNAIISAWLIHNNHVQTICSFGECQMKCVHCAPVQLIKLIDSCGLVGIFCNRQVQNGNVHKVHNAIEHQSIAQWQRMRSISA